MPNVRLETDYFVGGSSGLLDNRDNWTWVDGSKFAYTNWKSGQVPALVPSCLQLNAGSGKWTATSCDMESSFICKLPPKDRNAFTYPPPLPSCESGWTYFSTTNMCYMIVYDKTFAEGHSSCLEVGAKIVSIHSVAENSLVQGFASTHLNVDNYIYIGLHSPNRDGNYVWTDGTPFDYSNWFSSFPTCCSATPNDCVVMITDVASPSPDKWIPEEISNFFTYPCDHKLETVCQKKPIFS